MSVTNEAFQATLDAKNTEIARLVDALQEQVDECPDPECEMCIRHQALLVKYS